MNIAEYRRVSREVWEGMAPGWERRRAQLADALTPVREWLIEQLAPRPGDTVLELSAGAGDTGFAAAAIVGERGRLISSDFSAEMVEVARRRGGKLGLVWVAPERNPWASTGGRILVERGQLPPPEPGAPGIFSLASEERTRALLEGAGFADVRTEEVPVCFSYRDLDDYERWVMEVGGPFGMVVRGLPEDERSTLRAQLAEAFTPFEANGGYEIPGVALAAVAS